MGRVGFLGLLGIVFITLKLVGVIDWSWFWVSLPLWLFIPVGAFLFICNFLIGYFEWIRERKLNEKERMKGKAE